MKRLLTCSLFTVLVVLVQSAPAAEKVDYREALQPFNEFIGQWKGDALTARSPLDGATLAGLAVDTPVDAARKIDAAHAGLLEQVLGLGDVAGRHRVVLVVPWTARRSRLVTRIVHALEHHLIDRVAVELPGRLRGFTSAKGYFNDAISITKRYFTSCFVTAEFPIPGR